MKRTQINSKKYPGVFWYEPINKKLGRVFYIRWQLDGKREVEAVGSEKIDAMTEKRASEVRSIKSSKAKLGEYTFRSEKKKMMSLDMAYEMFMEINQKINKSWNSDMSRYKNIIQPEFGHLNLDKISPMHIEKYFYVELSSGKVKNNRGNVYSDQTIRHCLILISRIYNKFIESTDLELRNPIQKVKLKKINNKIEDEYLDKDTTKKFLSILSTYSDKNTANLFVFLFLTGFRKGEAFKLKWKDISWNDKEILIEEPKSGLNQKAYINDKAWNILDVQRRIVQSEYVFPGIGGKKRVECRRSWKTVKELSGIPQKFRLHGLRHNFAHQLVNSGEITPFELKAIMRHKDIKTSERYFKVDRERVQRASDVFAKLV